MEQDIRFCEVEGSRVAYATLGEGPLLVFGAKWVSHLEEEWDDPRARDFYTGLARSHRVIRYDRLGAGLSARELPRPPSIDLDTRVLRSVIHACGDEPATMFALSCSSVVTASLAARAPKLVRKIVFFGSYVSRDDLPDATRRSIVDFVRANWALASQMLAFPKSRLRRTRAATRSLRSAGTSGMPPTPNSRRPSSSSSCTATRGPFSRA